MSLFKNILKMRKKAKKIKKESNLKNEKNSLSSSSSSSDEEKNNYKYDDFLVDDYTEEEIEDSKNNNSSSSFNEDLSDSDLEVVGKKPERHKKKLKKKNNKEKNIDEDEDKNYFEKKDFYPNENNLPHKIFKVPKQNFEYIKAKKNINQIYSSDEMESQFITENDNIIKKKDFPERLQLRYNNEELLNLTDNIDREINYIIKKLKIINIIENENLNKKIKLILELNKKDFFDIPYIIFYKKYIYEPELTQENIWKIFELDRDYQEIINYRKLVLNQLNSIKKFIPQNEFSYIKDKYINEAQNIFELKNIEEYINYINELNFDEINNLNNYKSPIKNSLIIKCKNNKIDEFVKNFMLDINDIAINLEYFLKNSEVDKSGMYPCPNPKESPYDLATKYTLKNKNITDPKEIIEIANKFIAISLQKQPFLKKFIYQNFYEKCYLSTEPTEKGKNELDVFHPLFITKRIEKKPISTFNDDLYLYIIESESKGYINVNINIIENLKDDKKFLDEDDFKELNKILLTAAMPDNINKNVNSFDNWKLFRNEGIRTCIKELKNVFIEDIKKYLLKKSEKYTISLCADNFYTLLMSGPYRLKFSKNDVKKDYKFSDYSIPRIMSFVYDYNNNLTYSVILNKNGEVINHFIFQTLHRRVFFSDKKGNLYNNINDNIQKYNQDLNVLKNVVEEFKPDLIVVGISDINSRVIKENIDNFYNTYLNSPLNIIYSNIEIPLLFSNSEISEKILPNFNNSLILKQCISLGRLIQNPLEETLNLWNERIEKNFCLKIYLHPLQNLVNQKLLYNSLELKAIEAVNKIGVNINRAFEFNHLQSSLQFINGLGPRKSQLLLDSLIPTQGAFQKKLLYTQKICGKKTILQAIPFLYIKTNIYEIEEDYLENFDLLDITRIPLDWCPLARKLISEALNIENSNNITTGNIEDILKNPSLLDKLDINDYIKKLVENNINNYDIKNESELDDITKSYIEKINLIINELKNPFYDPRNQFVNLTNEQILSLLINDRNFREGLMVVSRVIKIDEKSVKCKLNNELDAILHLDDMQNEIEDYEINLIFESRIKQIDYQNFIINLTNLHSELESNEKYMSTQNLDLYFKILPEDKLNKKYLENKNKKHYFYRKINHEYFRNIGFNTCEELLKNKDIGECIFRPSFKLHHLTLSWKFYKFIISHIDIIELDKNPSDYIGNTLVINNDNFSNLDDIIKRYVEPCAKYTRDAISHRKFIHSQDLLEFQEKLKEQKERNPNTIVYNLTIVKRFPNYILLGYVPLNEVLLEYIGITQRGYYFHDNYFKDINMVISYFKKNFGSESYIDYFKKRNKEPENNNIRQQEEKIRRNENRVCNICKQKGHTAKFCNNKNLNEKEFLNNKRDRNDFNNNESNEENNNFNNNNRGGRGGRGRNGRGRGGRGRGKGGFNRKDNENKNEENNNNWNGWGNNNNENNENNNNSGWGANTEDNNNNSGWGAKTEDNNNNSGWGAKTEENNDNNEWGANNNENNNSNNIGWGSSTEIKEEKQEEKIESNNGWGSSNENINSNPWGENKSEKIKNEKENNNNNDWGNSENNQGW